MIMPRVCVAIPAYNAARTLPDVVARIQQIDGVDDILVVNDGSRDDTAAVAAAIAARHANFHVVHHEQNAGYGRAQKTLFRELQRLPGYGAKDTGVFLHSDGEMKPEEIPRFLVALAADDELDCVTGSRASHLDDPDFVRSGDRRPLWKVSADRALTAYLNLSFGLSLSTYFGGFRALRLGAIARLPIEELSNDHFFDIQFLACVAAFLKFREIAISNVEGHGTVTYSSMVLLRRIVAFGFRPELVPARRKAR